MRNTLVQWCADNQVLPLQKYPQFIVFVNFYGVNTSNMADFEVPRINNLLEKLMSISQSILASQYEPPSAHCQYFSSPFYQSCLSWSQGKMESEMYKTCVEPGHSIHRDYNVVF